MERGKRDARLELLTKVGTQIFDSVLASHISEGGDPEEIVFDLPKLEKLVDEYDAHLEAYRMRHIGSGKLVEGDKIAAMTGILIMRHNVFSSSTGHISTPFAAMVNQIFAVRITELFVQRTKARLTPSEQKHLYYCFTNCHTDDCAMTSWAVATMHGHLSLRNKQEQAYCD